MMITRIPNPEPDIAPSQESLIALDITPAEVADFIKCLTVILLMLDGRTVTDACQEVSIPRRSFYDEHWQALFAKAQKLITNRNLVPVRVAANLVADNWLEIVRAQVEIALHAQAPKDRTAAALFLHDTQIAPFVEQSSDDTPERSYLKGPKKNFNPLNPITAIQVQDGGTVNVHVNADEEVTITDAE